MGSVVHASQWSNTAPYNEDDLAPLLNGHVVSKFSLHENGDRLSMRIPDRNSVVVIRDDGQSCCEDRHMTCDDDLASFDGATLLKITIEDGPETSDDWETHEQQFVKIDTSKGRITLVTHNVHNGYYGGFDVKIVEYVEMGL